MLPSRPSRSNAYNNAFSGSLPPEFSTMTKLNYLCVAYAQPRLTQSRPPDDDDPQSPPSVPWRRVCDLRPLAR